MVKVCDRIMGTGKTQATINYLNDNPDGKYIYITPYLDEATRIRDGCPALNFVEPMRLRQYGLSKVNHTQSLILSGKNITTTHQAFKSYTPQMLKAIHDYGYTLIIDENVNVLESCDWHRDDIQMAVDAGYISVENGKYTLLKDTYHGEAMREMFRLLKSRQIMSVDTEDEYGRKSEMQRMYFWVLPQELVLSFRDVFILTYLFEGQSLYFFLKMYGIDYVNIGIERVDHGTGFSFCDGDGYTPEYVSHIEDMIDIVDSSKMNAIGDDETALSVSWFGSHRHDVHTLKSNIYNFFANRCKGVEPEKKMWSTYKSVKEIIKGKGYTLGYTALNLKATNQYRSAKYLTYACNLYMNVSEKIFYQQNGITVDEDAYALSIMIQWIWRSAIRDGEKICIYLPSKRMRRILNDWMKSLRKED